MLVKPACVIADLRLPIADSSYLRLGITLEKSAIGKRKSAMFVHTKPREQTPRGLIKTQD